MHHGLTNKYQKFAEELMHTCYLTYTMNPTMLAAELTHFNSEASVTYFFVFSKILTRFFGRGKREIGNIAV
jgi:hypothetical protein